MKSDIKTYRNSSIEAIKIVAMFLIVVSHVLQTLYTPSFYYGTEYVLDISHATENYKMLFLSWLASSGAIGNDIFFVCSAWFLVESSRVDGKKVANMIADVWVVSMGLFIAFLVFGNYPLATNDILNAIFPTTFAANWYITCYLLFYLIHNKLNLIIENVEQYELLKMVSILVLLYVVIDYFRKGLFFTNAIIEFVVIYFIVSYIKKYHMDFCMNRRANIICLIIGIMGIPLLIMATNLYGLIMPDKEIDLLRWGGNNSPFIIIMAISLLNLSQCKKYFNGMVNQISSVTLLIYIIHDNYLFRTYLRPRVWIYICGKWGYSNVVLHVFTFALVLFGVSTILALLYKVILQKVIHRMSNNLHLRIEFYYKKFTI